MENMLRMEWEELKLYIIIIVQNVWQEEKNTKEMKKSPTKHAKNEERPCAKIVYKILTVAIKNRLNDGRKENRLIPMWN